MSDTFNTPQGFLTDPNTLIALPGGGQVSVSFLAQQGVPGYGTTDTGQYFVPSDATAVGYGGSTYNINEHPDWFSPYYGQQQQKQKQGAADQANARATIGGLLNQYGLGSLTDWAWGLYTAGYNTDYIMQELRNRPEFQQRFPGIALRQKNGLSPISPNDYVALERSYDEILHASGLNSFYDRNTMYTQWIGGDVSPTEVKARADLASQAAFAEPVEVRAELQRMYGPSSVAVATAYFLDPTNALPEAQRRLAASEIGGGSLRSGYGLLTRDEAEHLASIGVTGDQAQQGFGKLTSQRELFSALPGEAGYQGLSQDQQIAAQFEGNATDQMAIQREAQARIAAFSGSTSYRVGQQGVAGLGSTSS